MTVITKISQAREKFHELKLEKTGYNTFSQYFYFQLSDFLIPALKVFREVGLCALVSFTKDEASMTITDLETGEEKVITSPMGSAALKGCHEVQNIGAVETYQRRYLWVAALEIVEHDAIDATVKTKEKKTISPTDGADKLVDPKRVPELEEAALAIHQAHADGKQLQAAEIYYAIPDNDEKVFVWSLLKPHSAVRSALKKNKPPTVATTKKEEVTA